MTNAVPENQSLLRAPNVRPAAPPNPAPVPPVPPVSPVGNTPERLLDDLVQRVLAITAAYQKALEAAGVDPALAAQRTERVHDLLWQTALSERAMGILFR